jgi:hypothetical protein
MALRKIRKNQAPGAKEGPKLFLEDKIFGPKLGEMARNLVDPGNNLTRNQGGPVRTALDIEREKVIADGARRAGKVDLAALRRENGVGGTGDGRKAGAGEFSSASSPGSTQSPATGVGVRALVDGNWRRSNSVFDTVEPDGGPVTVPKPRS